MDSFYVHLQSDSSQQYFDSNTITNFKNYLANPIKLDPDLFEVALSECSYTYKAPYLQEGTTIGSIQNVNSENIARINALSDDFKEFKLVEHSKGKTCLIPKRVLLLGKEQRRRFYDAWQVYKYTEGEFNTCEYSLIYIASFSLNYQGPKETVSNLKLIKALNLVCKEIGLCFTKVGDELILKENSTHLIIYALLNKKFTRALNIDPLVYNINKGILKLNQQNLKIGEDVVWENNEQVLLSEIIYYVQDVGILPNQIIPSSVTYLTYEYEHHMQLLKEYNITPKLCPEIHGKTNELILDKNINSVEELVDFVNKNTQYAKLSLKDGYVYIEILQDFNSIHFTSTISPILGLTETVDIITEEDKQFIKAKYKSFFTQGLSRMFVYCNIVEPQLIGNQYAPLLRICKYTGKENELSMLEFQNLQYVSIRVSDIQYIHMYLKSEAGLNLPIEVGSFSATLHFRRKKF